MPSPRFTVCHLPIPSQLPASQIWSAGCMAYVHDINANVEWNSIEWNAGNELCAKQVSGPEQEHSRLIAQPQDDAQVAGFSLVNQPIDSIIRDSEIAEQKLLQSQNCQPKTYMWEMEACTLPFPTYLTCWAVAWLVKIASGCLWNSCIFCIFFILSVAWVCRFIGWRWRSCLQCFDAVHWAAGRASEWWRSGMVVSLEWGADLHMAQLMPLSLTVSCFSKVQIGFTFLVLTHLGSVWGWEWRNFVSYLWPPFSCRHFVGKMPRIFCYCDTAYMLCW